jgi:hypothetical protein
MYFAYKRVSSNIRNMPITTDNFSFSTFLSVDFGDSSGSGFRINHNGKDYIITARHVVYNKNVPSRCAVSMKVETGGQ